MPRILVIEDNADLAFGLRNNLEIEGYAIEVADDGNKGLMRARATTPDLIILDLMIPGLDGYRVLRTLRDEGHNTPVLILSARGEEADKVRGFRLGADDYVTKPFSLLELLARVEALLRRSSMREGSDGELGELLHFGEISIDPKAQIVYRRFSPVEVTHREFLLLLALARRGGGVVSRQELLREVWGHQVEVITRTVDVHIMELRKKIEDDPARPRYILTVRKMGYRLRS